MARQTVLLPSVPTRGVSLLLSLLVLLALLMGSAVAEGAWRSATPWPASPESPSGLSAPEVAIAVLDADAPAIHPAARPEGPVVDALDHAAETRGLDRALLRAIAWTESSFRPAVVSSAGAVGIMQLMPVTVLHAQDLLGRPIDPLVVSDNVEAGAAYLHHLLGRAEGDVRTALAAYHEGWAGVHRDGVSSASAGYVQRVIDLQAEVAITLAG